MPSIDFSNLVLRVNLHPYDEKHYFVLVGSNA